MRHRADITRRRRQLRSRQRDLEGPPHTATERPLDLVARHVAHVIAGEIVDGQALARFSHGEIELHLLGIGADPPASVVEVEPAVAALVATVGGVVLDAEEPDQEGGQRCRRGLEEEGARERDLRRR